MCATEEQVRWLVDRMTSGIYAEWPGIAEMRACFCYRYKPRDGVEAYSSVYAEMPRDPTAPPRPEIAAPYLKALPPGHEVTPDPELEASIQQLAEKCKMPPAHPIADKFATMLREMMTAPSERLSEDPPVNPNFKPITQADVDRAVQELHERRAREAADAIKEKIVNIRSRD
jgi:hypothetical protein